MTTPEAALLCLDVTKNYGNHRVLDAVSFTVHAGESFGLVGVNGAGKTTLIKSLLDFSQIDSGTLTIFGVDHRKPDARARLAYLPERFLPPHYLKGREFLEYMARLHGVSFDTDNVLRLFAAVDLEASALDKPVRQFSKGMAQKLGLAACFLSGKELLVLDEPMSGLDPKARALLKQQFQLLRSQRKTLFFSTHMLADVEALCDRIAILHGGRVAFIGTPQQCCAQFAAPNLEQAYMACISR